MIERNKGHTIESTESVRIPCKDVIPLRDSLLKLLELVELNNSKKVQLKDVKNIYKLLDFLTKPK